MLNGNIFYFQTIRKLTLAFGTLFDNISIRRFDEDSNVTKTIRVPIAYGPSEYYITIANHFSRTSTEAPDIQIRLPRMSFELSSIAPARTRTMNPLLFQKRIEDDSTNNFKTQLNATPYDLGFQLHIMSRNVDDMIQIAEQILPYNEMPITINEIPDMSIKRDVRAILTNIDIQDDYEGVADSAKRTLIWTLSYNIEGYVHKPIELKSPILSAITNFHLSELERIEEIYTHSVDPDTAKKSESWDIIETQTFPEEG